VASATSVLTVSVPASVPGSPLHGFVAANENEVVSTEGGPAAPAEVAPASSRTKAASPDMDVRDMERVIAGTLAGRCLNRVSVAQRPARRTLGVVLR
jgi:hypothetical protein